MCEQTVEHYEVICTEEYNYIYFFLSLSVSG